MDHKRSAEAIVINKLENLGGIVGWQKTITKKADKYKSDWNECSEKA